MLLLSPVGGEEVFSLGSNYLNCPRGALTQGRLVGRLATPVPQDPSSLTLSQ